MAYTNKQILTNFQEMANNLKKVLESKEELINEAKKDMTPDQVKEFTAMEKIMNEKLKSKDYLSAMRTIQKMKVKHQEEKEVSQKETPRTEKKK